MFHNDQQSCRAIRVMLRAVGMEDYWTASGPTEAAVQLCQTRAGALSGKVALLQVAFYLWEGDGDMTPTRLLLGIDREAMALLWSLMVAAAQGKDAVDTWIATTERRIAARGAETAKQKQARHDARGAEAMDAS
jgi:hypothetical protein